MARLLPLALRFVKNWQISNNDNVSGGFEITPSTAAGGTTFSTPALFINSSGNVGIGTTSPGTALHINGGDQITPALKVQSAIYPVIDLYSNFVAMPETGELLVSITPLEHLKFSVPQPQVVRLQLLALLLILQAK
jgi:hypothetical protein